MTTKLKTYYGEEVPSAFTFLEFGAVNVKEGKKTIWDFRLHQQAYDLFMIGRYLKDLLAFRKLTNDLQDLSIDEQWQYYKREVHTRDIANTFSKLAALHICGARTRNSSLSFVELGSTLLGAIDAMTYIQTIGQKLSPSFSSLDLRNISYHGIDISELLNDAAREIHPEHSIETHLEASLFEHNVDVFFSKGVSILYAFSGAPEFVELLTKASVSSFDYTFALKENQPEALHATGKQVMFLSLADVIKAAKNIAADKQFFFHTPTAKVDRDNSRLSVICYYGQKELIEETVAEEIRLRTEIYNAMRSPESRELLFDNKIFPTTEKHPRDSQFLEVEEFIEHFELF